MMPRDDKSFAKPPTVGGSWSVIFTYIHIGISTIAAITLSRLAHNILLRLDEAGTFTAVVKGPFFGPFFYNDFNYFLSLNGDQ